VSGKIFGVKTKLMNAEAAAMSRVAGRIRRLVTGTHDFSEQRHSNGHKTCPKEIRVEMKLSVYTRVFQERSAEK
jgi:hypothetical protein